MGAFVIDLQIVDSFLGKPIELEREWKRVCGQSPDGLEKPEFYTADDVRGIRNEADRLYTVLSAGRRLKPVDKSFVLTAGSPGAGKTTLLNAWLAAKPQEAKGVYADPDETILKEMTQYREDMLSQDPKRNTMAMAYAKWRWASNFIMGTLMNRACQDGYDIVHGTTATSQMTKALYQNVRSAGYEITTLIVAAPENVRMESIRQRYHKEKSRYIPDADVSSKAALFYERLPVYFGQSDHFELYWRKGSAENAILAAQGNRGSIQIVDGKTFGDFENDLASHSNALSWPDLAASYLRHYSGRNTVPKTPRPA